MTSIKQNKIEIISTLQKEDYNIALKFVELGKSLDCPNTIRFANAHKAWKIVYNSSKPKRILYTIECRKIH